jgi:aspartyl/asparaginyl beta-hydroxylase (cupin superfamily)
VPRHAGTIGIGVLLGGTRIRPHCGLSNAKLRCHLGLSVPPRCTLQVGGETRTWQEGRAMIFDDSFEHSVSNESDQPRYALILDVFHPALSDADVSWVERQTLPPPSKRRAIERAAAWTVSTRT